MNRTPRCFGRRGATSRSHARSTFLTSLHATTSPTVPSRAEPSEEQPTKIVVVGAGLAGLTAAREFQRSGVDAVVLEARDRVGGRR